MLNVFRHRALPLPQRALRINTVRRGLATPASDGANEMETEEERKEMEQLEQFLAKKKLEKPARPQLNVKVDEDHGLYGFFRSDERNGVKQYETVESILTPTQEVGRAWNAVELRRKSFKDLHTLWYILLRERNLLATQKAEAKRLRIQNGYMDIDPKDGRCRRAMARIKQILTERKSAYEEAYSLRYDEVVAAQKVKDSARTAKDREAQLTRKNNAPG